MGVFIREIKTQRKPLFFWSIGMIVLLASGMAKFSAYETAGQSIVEMMKQFPKTIQTLFGLSGFDLTKASGFYGVLFLYIALMATIHAVLLGSNIIAKEERDHTSEFLFTRPTTRNSVIMSKILAGLINIFILNIITTISSILLINYFGKSENFVGTIILLMIGLFILQLIFFFIGTCVASKIKRPKLSGSIATSVLMITFFIMFLINFNEKLDFLKYLTPFKYFDALSIMTSGKIDLLFVFISTILIIVSFIMTFVFYKKRDLTD